MATGRQRLRFRLEALSAGLLLSAAGLLTAPACFAGDGAFYFDHGGPVIVDRRAEMPASLGQSLAARPIPTSRAQMSVQASLGNLHVVRTAEIPCGERTPSQLVLCLDADGRLGDADALALLARAPRAVSVEVGSLKARSVVLATLQSASLERSFEPTVTTFASCSGACDGRVVIRTAP